MAFKGLRFQKRIKIAPGLRVNLSKSGISASAGAPGATVNVGDKGVKATVGVPGTGLSYSKKLGGAGKAARGARQDAGGGMGTVILIGVVVLVGLTVLFWYLGQSAAK